MTILSIGTRSNDSVTVNSVTGSDPAYTVTLSAAVPSTTKVGDRITDSAANKFLITAISGSDLTARKSVFGSASDPATGAATTQRAYATVGLWESGAPDLVATTQTWEGECYNDSVLGGFTVSGNTTSATYFMKLTAAAGQSFKDHANKLTNALKYNSSNGVALYSPDTFANMISVTQAYFYMSNLMIRQASADGTTHTIDVDVGSTNFTISNCIVENEGSDLCLKMRHSSQKAVNCLFVKATANGTSGGAVAAQGGSDLIACTVVKTSDAADSGTGISSYNGDATVTNTAMFGFATAMQSTGFINANYNATDQTPADSGPNDQDSLTYTSQFENTTNAAFDFRVKSGSGLINNGTRDAANTSDLDIIGQSRSTTTPTIGCWEFIASGGGTQTLNPTLFTNTNTFYSPTVSPGAVTLSPGLVSNTNTFYAPTVTSSYALTAPLVSNTNTFYGPTVTASYTLSPSLFANTNTFYSPTVVGNQAVSPPLLVNTNVFYGATVMGGETTSPHYGGGYESSFLDYGENARKRRELEAFEEPQTQDVEIKVKPVSQTKPTKKRQDRLEESTLKLESENAQLKALQAERDTEIKRLMLLEQQIRQEDEEILILYAATLRQPMKIAA